MADEARPAGPSEATNPFIKLAIDFGPLVAFFAVYYLAERYRPESGIYWATGALMATTGAALLASRLLLGRISMAPLVTAVFVAIFGGLTFWLQDPSFIKVKPTIINLLFASALVFGLITGRPFLKLLMGEALRLTDRGWHKLTVRWVAFFLAMAALNETIWRHFSEATWVAFKAWGILPLTLLFALAQVGLIKRHEAKINA